MKIMLAFLGVCLFVSCASTSELKYDEKLAFDARNYALSAELINDKIADEKYSGNDEVMYSLELGSINHLDGNYKESNRYFTAAEDAIDKNYTKSISRGFASFISNDNALVYDGEPYEDTYLSAFMALNYLHENDLEGALVEARKIAYKLEQTAIKAKGLSEVIGNGDGAVFKMIGKDEINYDLGELTVQDSPFSHYLSTILLAKTDKPDDARIEFTRFEESVNVHAQQLGQANLVEVTEQPLQDYQSYNTVLVGFSGRAPKKIGKKAEVNLSLVGVDFVYAYPELQLYEPVTTSLEVVVDGKTKVALPIIENMDLVAAEVFNYKLPVIKTRALLRGAAKGGLKAVAKNKAKKHGGFFAGLAADVIGSAIADASEQADTRSWGSLPGKVHANVLNLEPGMHEVVWNYYDSLGRLRYTKKENVEIFENKPLTLVQSEFSCTFSPTVVVENTKRTVTDPKNYFSKNNLDATLYKKDGTNIRVNLIYNDGNLVYYKTANSPLVVKLSPANISKIAYADGSEEMIYATIAEGTE